MPYSHGVTAHSDMEITCNRSISFDDLAKDQWNKLVRVTGEQSRASGGTSLKFYMGQFYNFAILTLKKKH